MTDIEFCVPAGFAAVEIGGRAGMAGKKIVIILPSSAERYLSTALFADLPEGSDPEP